MVKALKDKPVKFLAIGANMTSAECAAYQQQTGLAMPIFADSLGLMQKRYGQQISLQNIWQIRILSADGKVAGLNFTKEEVEKALGQVKTEWKYKGETYEAKLDPALDSFEWGLYPQGMKLLAPLRKSTNKALAESAKKLFDAVKKEGEEWKAEADKLAEAEPVKAYDLYSKVATVFAGDELGKSVAEPLKKLTATKPVSADLAARKSFAPFAAMTGKATPAQKPAALKFCQDAAKKYSGTPTGDKADSLAAELGK